MIATTPIRNVGSFVGAPAPVPAPVLAPPLIPISAPILALGSHVTLLLRQWRDADCPFDKKHCFLLSTRPPTPMVESALSFMSTGEADR